MKFRTTLAFALSFGAITSFASLALAQTSAPTPAVVTLTTQTAIVTILSLVAGFIGQAVNSGSLFGIVTTPKAWIPYLTLLGSFVTAFGLSLQGDSTLNGTAWFNAVVAGFMALMSAAGGAAAHSHLNSHKKSGAAPTTPTAASAGGGK
jgi:hypothetical protein